MGSSADATIFYGFTFEDPEHLADGWEEFLAEKLGLDGRGLSRLINHLGCEVIHYGDLGYDVYYMGIGISGHRITAYPDHNLTPEDVSLLSTSNPTWDENIKELAKLLEIEYQQPGWVLVASYG